MLSRIVIDGANVTAKFGYVGLSDGSSPSPSPSPLPLCETGRKENEFSMNVGPMKVLNGEFGGENRFYIDGERGTPVVSENIGPVPGGYRYAFKHLTYRIPVPFGTYTVTSFHAEQYFNAPGKRVFTSSSTEI